MRIAAALCWHDEPVESLTRCVESLAGVADVLVAYDGRWAEFPGDAILSPRDETEAVVAAAAAAGLPLALAGPPVDGAGDLVAWESQVAKRAALYGHAARLAEWVLIVDGDEWIERCDPVELRARLAVTSRLIGTVAMNGAAGRPGVRRRVFSTVEGLTVERAHNGVRTLAGRWLAGDHCYVSLEQPVDLTGVLELGHDRGGSRSKARNDADHMYRMVRRSNGSERWKRERSTP